MDLDSLIPYVKEDLQREGLWKDSYDKEEADWFRKTVDLIRARFHTIHDFSGWGRCYFSDEFEFDAAAVQKNLKKDPRIADLLLDLADRLRELESFDQHSVEDLFRAFAQEKDIKAGLIINGTRTAISGTAVGPGLFEMLEILGKDRVVARMKGGIRGMTRKYQEEDLFATVKTSWLSMIALMALHNHLHVYGEKCVFPQLQPIKIGDYYIDPAVQEHALKLKEVSRFIAAAGFRGVFSAMYEGLKNNPTFSRTVKNSLQNNYEDFYDLVNLFRNLYSHEITWSAKGDIILKEEDYERLKQSRARHQRPPVISFSVLFRDVIPEITWPPEYGIKLRLDTNDLEEGKTLGSLVTIFDQQILAEFCYNFCTHRSS